MQAGTGDRVADRPAELSDNNLFGLIYGKKLSGKTLNAFCKRYFQHSNANHIFGSGSKYFEVFR